MAYAFNEDRSKVDVYTEDEIDAKNAEQDQAIANEAGTRSIADTLINARIDTLVDHGTGGIEVREEIWSSNTGVVSGTISVSGFSPSLYDCFEILIDNGSHSTEIHRVAKIGGTIGGTVSMSLITGDDKMQTGSISVNFATNEILVTNARYIEYASSGDTHIFADSTTSTMPVLKAVYGIKYAQDCSAEVADTRVGGDGVSYPSAGNAVRGQVSDIDARFNKLSGLLPLHWSSGTVDASGNDYPNSKYIRTGMVKVDPGSIVNVMLGNDMRCFTWEYDSNGDFIQQNSYKTSDYKLVTTASTSFIRFGLRGDTVYAEIDRSFADDVIAYIDNGLMLIDHGLMDDNSDLNDFKKMGMWHVASNYTIANLPVSNLVGVLLVFETFGSPNETVVQFFHDSYTLWTRIFSAGSWRKWEHKAIGAGETVSSSNYSSKNITNVLEAPDGVTYFNATITSGMVSNLPEYGKAQTVLKLNALGNTSNAGILFSIIRDGSIYAGMQYSGLVSWRKLFDIEEATVDPYIEDVNYFLGFRKIGVVGDSYASGYNNSTDGDCRDNSWPAHLARISGATVYNLSKHGMSAERFLSGTFAPGYDINTLTDGNHDVPAYIIGLGLNDAAYNQVGTADDFDLSFTNTTNTIYGNFSNLIRAIDLYYTDSGLPTPFIFICNVPYREDADGNPVGYNTLNAAIEDIASLSDSARGKTYLVPLRSVRPLYQKMSPFMTNTHYTPCAQRPMADILLKVLNKVMLDNASDFLTLSANQLNR